MVMNCEQVVVDFWAPGVDHGASCPIWKSRIPQTRFGKAKCGTSDFRKAGCRKLDFGRLERANPVFVKPDFPSRMRKTGFL